MTTALLAALMPETRGLQAFYQPIVATNNLQPLGVEALARWDHNVLGNVPPQLFVALAEKTGHIQRLGLHMLSMAVQNCKHRPDLFVSWNVSPLQLERDTFATEVLRLTQEASFESERLVLEVTENQLAQDVQTAKRNIHHLRDSGVRLALDDAGTGFADKSALSRLPLDIVKLDKSLVKQALINPKIMLSWVEAAQSRGLTVIAEGIETEDEQDICTQMGVDAMQGYLFGHPAPSVACNEDTNLVRTSRLPS